VTALVLKCAAKTHSALPLQRFEDFDSDSLPEECLGAELAAVIATDASFATCLVQAVASTERRLKGR
jgi:hypothetical protein